MPTLNSLHVLVVNEQSANVVCGEHRTDNGTQFGEAMSYMCLENHCDDGNATGVTETDVIDVTGVTVNRKFSEVMTEDKNNVDSLENAIDAIDKIRGKFSRRD